MVLQCNNYYYDANARYTHMVVYIQSKHWCSGLITIKLDLNIDIQAVVQMLCYIWLFPYSLSIGAAA